MTLFELLGPVGIIGALSFSSAFMRPFSWWGFMSMAVGAGAGWATFQWVLRSAKSRRGLWSPRSNWVGGLFVFGLFAIYFGVTAGVTKCTFEIAKKIWLK